MGDTYRAEFRGQRFDVPIHIDEETTRACLKRIEEAYTAAEEDAEVVNTQVFALQTAYRLAVEREKAAAEHSRQLAAMKASHERALAEAQSVTRDLEHEIADALKGLSTSLRELLNEFGGTPSAPLKFPGRRDD